MWVVRPTQPDVEVTCLVHAVGGSQDDVLIEDGAAAEASVVFVHEESLKKQQSRRS